MNAVHWVRSRQEDRELSYWLSIVYYNRRDRSLNNRIYLLYLILFFSVWFFVVLTFFASGGALILPLIDPLNPVRAALFLELFLLAVWSGFSFWRSTRRSPLVFSEQDEVLVCQTPVSRRHLTLRWILMPWLKSAVPFWLAAIVLGFSLAEITMPGALTAGRIFEYAGYGLRAWGVVIPIHLALFALQWALGIARLHKDQERHWLGWLVIPIAIAFYTFLLIFTFNPNPGALIPWVRIASAMTAPLRAGFEPGSLLPSLLSGGLFALAALGIMVACSGGFNLSRAAQETNAVDLLEAAQRFGFSAYARQLQDQHRLGVNHAPSRLPVFGGGGVLVWKDLLQSQRLFRLSSTFIWFGLFLLMLGVVFLPDLGSRALAIGYWVFQLGQAAVVRIRGDLSLWPLIRQVPLSHKKFLLFDLLPAFLLSLLVSEAGLLVGSALFKGPIAAMALFLPGIVASVAGMAAFDVIRQSRSHLLLVGAVPEVSAIGVILGLVVAAFPFLIVQFIPGWVGLVLATLSSLALGLLAFSLAARSYRNIDAS